jgi:hypothetical protein
MKCPGFYASNQVNCTSVMPVLANLLNLMLQGLLFVAYACVMGGLVSSLLIHRP